MDMNTSEKDTLSVQPTIKKPLLLYIVGIIIVIIASGVGGFYFGENYARKSISKEIDQTEDLKQETPAPMRLTDTNSSEKKLYTSTSMELSFEYPTQLFVSESPFDAITISYEPLPTEPTPVGPESFVLDQQDESYADIFDALYNAGEGEDVPEAHNAVYVEIEKIRNFEVNGYRAVEYTLDGVTPIPENPEFGRGPEGYSHVFVIERDSKKYLRFTNSSMDLDTLSSKDIFFQEIFDSIMLN